MRERELERDRDPRRLTILRGNRVWPGGPAPSGPSNNRLVMRAVCPFIGSRQVRVIHRVGDVEHFELVDPARSAHLGDLADSFSQQGARQR